ncbi:hypothetical protein GCM10010245_87850 [Streptomyces spectabilis]|nr:hypothetical protein GCM10010245_87850 [Streptomyces spectabilis]
MLDVRQLEYPFVCADGNIDADVTQHLLNKLGDNRVLLGVLGVSKEAGRQLVVLKSIGSAWSGPGESVSVYLVPINTYETFRTRAHEPLAAETNPEDRAVELPCNEPPQRYRHVECASDAEDDLSGQDHLAECPAFDLVECSTHESLPGLRCGHLAKGWRGIRRVRQVHYGLGVVQEPQRVLDLLPRLKHYVSAGFRYGVEGKDGGRWPTPGHLNCGHPHEPGRKATGFPSTVAVREASHQSQASGLRRLVAEQFGAQTAAPQPVDVLDAMFAFASKVYSRSARQQGSATPS